MTFLSRFTLVVGVILFLLVLNALRNGLFDIYGNNRFKIHSGSCRTRRGGKLRTKLLNSSCSVLGKNLESVYKSVYNIGRKLFGKLAGNH